MHLNRILICEQNVDHAELLNYNLQKAGFQPNISSHEDILSVIAAEKPEMVILGSTTNDQEKAVITAKLKSNPALHEILVLCLTTDDSCCLSQSHHVDACIILPQKPKMIVQRIKELFQQALVISN